MVIPRLARLLAIMRRGHHRVKRQSVDDARDPVCEGHRAIILLGMCRNIRPLFNSRAARHRRRRSHAAASSTRKVSGTRKPSGKNIITFSTAPWSKSPRSPVSSSIPRNDRRTEKSRGRGGQGAGARGGALRLTRAASRQSAGLAHARQARGRAADGRGVNCRAEMGRVSCAGLPGRGRDPDSESR